MWLRSLYAIAFANVIAPSKVNRQRQTVGNYERQDTAHSRRGHQRPRARSRSQAPLRREAGPGGEKPQSLLRGEAGAQKSEQEQPAPSRDGLHRPERLWQIDAAALLQSHERSRGGRAG